MSEPEFSPTASTSPRKWLIAFCGLAVLASGSRIHAANVINSASGLFTPSFRDSSNTTWFGWGPISGFGAPYGFDGGADNELMESPSPNINPTPGAALVQNNSLDLLSGTNSIFYPPFGVPDLPDSSVAVDLTLTIPTGVPGTEIGSGFTTIIIQGRGTSNSDFTKTLFFGEIAGVSPEFVFARNAVDGSGGAVSNGTGLTQWWAKYEIPGSAASYSVDVSAQPGAHMFSPVSVGELIIDTYWSANGFAPDTALVPEPSAALLTMFAAGAACSVTCLRRKRHSHMNSI